MARNTLAVRMNLERLGIELDTRCVMCNGLNEDGGHLFLGCKYVKHVWRANGMELEHSWQRRDQEGRWSSVFLICRKGAKLKSQASEHLFSNVPSQSFAGPFYMYKYGHNEPPMK
jgi:hypothetical protein